MGYFEFLPCSRIICLLLNISEKLNQKRQRLIAFIFVNTIQYPYTLKNNIYHSSKCGLPLFFHSNTNPILGHVLVVTVEMIWLLFLNILSFNFVHRLPDVVLTNHCQSYTTFYLMCSVQSGDVPFFVAIFLLLFCSYFAKSISVAQMLITPSWLSRRKDTKQSYIQLELSIPSAAEQRFLLIPIQQRRQTVFFSSAT